MELKPKILVVDDELGPRESLRMILSDDYMVVTAAGGKQAVDHFEDHEFCLAILDIRMPDINGLELMKVLKQKNPLTEIVLITAYASVETATGALREGALDYLIKPFDYTAVREVVKKGIARREESLLIEEKLGVLQLANKSLEDEIAGAYKNIQKHYKETIDSLVAAVDAKDSYTKGHQERVGHLVKCYGKAVKMDENCLVQVIRAAHLHDIGKIGVAEHVLRKPGALNNEEYEAVKKHSAIGAEILSRVAFLKDAVPLVLHHHECYDGTGYPHGLSGESIPLGARIIAVADAIDAMQWDRPYHKAKPFAEVKEELFRGAGYQFDPDVVSNVLKENVLDVYEHWQKNRT